MISKNTAPGTMVVCIVEKWDTPPSGWPRGMGPLEYKAIYTVSKMTLCFDGKVGVELAETSAGHKCTGYVYERSCFEYVSLPKSIIDCLNVEKIPDAIAAEALAAAPCI
jgi:hypothetical protein